MGGLCGVVAEKDCVSDLFFGTDYHSHLGTHRGGMAVLGASGFQRSIHNIQNSPFRSKFEHDIPRFEGRVGIGVISDTDPQPLVMCSKLGTFAIATVGLISNIEELKKELFQSNSAQLQFSTTSGMVGPTEVVSALIATQGSLVEGVKYVQSRISGSCTILIMAEDGRLYAARDRYGRTPLVLGRGEREQLTANVDLPQVVSAPVEEGQILGKVTFSVKDRVVGSCFLRAKQAVEKLSFSDMLLWMLSALARRPDTAANADLTNTGK